jgi:hypothetical protein
LSRWVGRPWASSARCPFTFSAILDRCGCRSSSRLAGLPPPGLIDADRYRRRSPEGCCSGAALFSGWGEWALSFFPSPFCLFWVSAACSCTRPRCPVRCRTNSNPASAIPLILWKVYALFTVAEVILLMAGGMSFFDALNAMPSPPCPPAVFQPRTLRWPTSTVSISMSSLCFHAAGRHQFFSSLPVDAGETAGLLERSECRFFLAMCLILTLCQFNIYGAVYAGCRTGLRYAAFQVVSIVTTTGYATADYENGRPCHRPSSFCACLWARRPDPPAAA